MGDDLCLVRLLEDGKGDPGGWLIYCPGCHNSHLFDNRWKFNGDVDKPTFMPSMLVNGSKIIKEYDGETYGHRCHSFVTDGKIKFLSDCTHSMAGQTVDLEPF